MAGRMLSIKFGADTTRLERAMKRVRKSMANMFTARGLIGGAIAGVGAAGVIGAAMNLNPRVANSILRLESHLTGAFASALYKMEPAIVRLTDVLIQVGDAFLKGIGEASAAYAQTGQKLQIAGQAAGNIVAGQYTTGALQGLLFGMTSGLTAPTFGVPMMTTEVAQALADELQRRPRFVPTPNDVIGATVRKMMPGRTPNGN